MTWSEVDRAVERIIVHPPTLRRGARRGRSRAGSVLANPAHRALAREAAAKSVVLLRNEPVAGLPVLPLDLEPGSSTLALLGQPGHRRQPR